MTPRITTGAALRLLFDIQAQRIAALLASIAGKGGGK